MSVKLEVVPFGLKYRVRYKAKWWHRWRYKTRPNKTSQRWLWDTRKGAQAYINQETKRLDFSKFKDEDLFY